MIRKALLGGADAVVVDLEDAVPEPEKDHARHVTADALSSGAPAAGTAVFVRVSPRGSRPFDADLAAVLEMPASGVVLPKAETPCHVGDVAGLLADRRPDMRLIVGIETARGVADAFGLLTDGLDAIYFGAEDFVADVGGRRTPSNLEVLYARSHILLAARLAGIPAIDQAVTAFREDERFRVDAREGRDLGYIGKICIHPRQVLLAHEVFSPTSDELAHANAVIQAARSGVGAVEGSMVDTVHVRMARTVLERARRAGGGDG